MSAGLHPANSLNRIFRRAGSPPRVSQKQSRFNMFIVSRIQGRRPMKTTVELPDTLYRQAKAEAVLRGRKLKDLVEEGLRIVLEAPPAPARRADLAGPMKPALGVVGSRLPDLGSNSRAPRRLRARCTPSVTRGRCRRPSSIWSPGLVEQSSGFGEEVSGFRRRETDAFAPDFPHQRRSLVVGASTIRHGVNEHRRSRR